MASWQGNYDNSANAPYWSAFAGHLRANNTNAGTLLYENNADNLYRPKNVSEGVFLVDYDEEATQGPGRGSQGWVLRTVGTGGRAGRTQEETLMCVKSIRTTNPADNSIFPDASVVITTQPATRQYFYSNSTFSNTVSFTVAASTLPVDATVTYQWQYNSADGSTGWTNIKNGTGLSLSNTVVSGNTTATLTLAANTIYSCNTAVFRALVTATPLDINNVTGTSAVTVNSANGQVIVFAGV